MFSGSLSVSGVSVFELLEPFLGLLGVQEVESFLVRIQSNPVQAVRLVLLGLRFANMSFMEGNAPEEARSGKEVSHHLYHASLVSCPPRIQSLALESCQIIVERVGKNVLVVRQRTTGKLLPH